MWLNGFFAKKKIYNLFSESQLDLYIFIASLFVNLYLSLSYHFSVLKIFQGFGLSFNQNARTLGGGVDNLLNGSRVHSLFLERKPYLFQGNTAFAQGNRRCIRAPNPKFFFR